MNKEFIAATDQNRIRVENSTINIIKGIAIILVIVNHFSFTRQERMNIIFPFFVEMAVPVFMIISGYVNSISFEKRGIDSLNKAYNRNLIKERLVRYSVPFFIAVIYMIIDPNLTNYTKNDPLSFLQWIISGTMGQGSYYYPIMVQFIFVFPLCYFTIKHGHKRLRTCFLISIVLEILLWGYGINQECYRLLIIRYLFMIFAGIYAHEINRLSRGCSIVLTILGGGYIGVIWYSGYNSTLFQGWASTSCFAALFVIPAMIYVINNVSVSFPPLEIIGRASYHIMFTQMIFYLVYSKRLGVVLASRKLNLIFGLLICITIGVVFYCLEKLLMTGIKSLATYWGDNDK